MIHTKRLRSVIHSTAHHGVSGLSFLHPHAGEACRNAGIHTIAVDLLKPGFIPPISNTTKELKLSSEALRNKFANLLCAEGIEPSTIVQGFAQFAFHNDIWPSTCYVQVVTTEGKMLEVAVDSIGSKTEVLHKDS
jgi:hypothetical protein